MLVISSHKDRRPPVHGAETALFAKGRPGAYSTRSGKLSRTPGLGGCPALGSRCPHMLRKDREQPPKTPAAPKGWSRAVQDAGRAEATGLLCSRNEVNAHTLHFPLKDVY